MSTGAYWWHATGASGGTASVATPPTVAAIAAIPAPTIRASAQTLFEAPGGVFADNIAETSLVLNWTGVFGITKYDIERNGVIIQTDWALTAYPDTGLTPGTFYRYRVRAKP